MEKREYYDKEELLSKMRGLDWQELYLPVHFKDLVFDEVETVEGYTKQDVLGMLTKLQDDFIECIDGGEVSGGIAIVDVVKRQAVFMIQKRINEIRGSADEVSGN